MRVILFILLFLVPIQAFAQPRQYSEILKSKELRICYVPWISKDTLPDYPSPYMEMAVAFAKKKGLKPKVEKIAWNDQFMNSANKIEQGQSYTPLLFDNQRCDLFSNSISPLEWRKKLMDLNWIYISNVTVVVRKEDKKKFKTPKDLKNKTVVVMPNTTYHDWLLDYQKTLSDSEKMKIVEVPEGGTIGLLLSKKADFILFESQQALYSKIHISKDVTIAFPVGKATESGWGYPKGSEELKAETMKYFEEERNSTSSEVNAIYMKYFGLTLAEYNNLHYLVSTN